MKRKTVKVSVVVDEGVHCIFQDSHNKSSSSREWAKRYRNMILHYEFLKTNATNKQKRDELRGYEKCLVNFYNASCKNSMK